MATDYKYTAWIYNTFLTITGINTHSKRILKEVMARYWISWWKFLDIWASSGEISLFLQESFPDAEVVAIDYVEEMLDVINKRKQKKQITQNITVVHGDINNLDSINKGLEAPLLSPGSVDLIHLWAVLEHCDIENKFVDMFSYLKSNWIIVTTFLQQNLWWKSLAKVYDFDFVDKELIKKIASQHGYAVEEYQLTGTYFPLNLMRFCLVIYKK